MNIDVHKKTSFDESSHVCCICLEKLDCGSIVESETFISLFLDETVNAALEIKETKSLDDGRGEKRLATPICSNDSERHLMCSVCALEMIKHNTNSCCPLCKSELNPTLQVCQRFWGAQKQLQYLYTRQQSMQQVLQAKIKQLRDSFAHRFEQQYYVRETPKPCKFEVKVSTQRSDTAQNSIAASLLNSYRGESAMSWQRQDEGKTLSTTMSGIIRAHENIDANEWKRLVEHTMGINIDSHADVSRQLFTEQCNTLHEEIPFLMRWPQQNLEEEMLSDAEFAQTLQNNPSPSVPPVSAPSFQNSFVSAEEDRESTALFRFRNRVRSSQQPTIQSRQARGTSSSTSESTVQVPNVPISRSWRFPS